MPPGTPFFPAAYHHGPTCFSLGLQGAPLVIDVVNSLLETVTPPLDLETFSEVLRLKLQEVTASLFPLIAQLTEKYQFPCAGIDYSPAPLGEASIARAIELCGYGSFGSPGTLSVVGAITRALKSQISDKLPAIGYNGVMLPVMEDAVISQRWAEGRVNLQQLLLYSAVCGTGLDTVPLSGDIAEDVLMHILQDVVTLATRSNKALSARLFPVPGRHAGEHTAFSSVYLVNTLIKGPL
jgi:uncharacterized protein (UPF0210 family)